LENKYLDKNLYMVYKGSMKTFMVPSKEKKQIIRGYLDKKLSQADIGRMLGISRQLVQYWVNVIKDDDRKGKTTKPKNRII
jgi:transposase-like protein